MKLSLISPSRNNLKYLKWSYNSVRKNCSPDIEYCVASDFSNDGTVEWCEETAKNDPLFKFIVNDGTWFGENKGEPKRMGHTLLYDKLISEVATSEKVMIWHADMYAAKDMDMEVLRVLKPKTVVSVTRIEPPLHPEGPEKLVMNFGTEPEEFNEERFLKFADDRGVYNTGHTQGMFAPWIIHKEDFLAIGGHDPLYAPQSREDSDIFNRFLLVGYKPIQTWDTFVYHMTCRGSRFNSQLTRVGQASMEWLNHNKKSERNFTRKWGHMVRVDENLKPIVPHKYDISFVVKNCSKELLEILEPWCSRIYCDTPPSDVMEYIKQEQPNTMYDLLQRILHFVYFPNFDGDIIIEFDGQKLTQQLFQSVITQLLFILDDNVDEVGEYEFDIFNVNVRKIKHYENDLIVCDKSKNVR